MTSHSFYVGGFFKVVLTKMLTGWAFTVFDGSTPLGCKDALASYQDAENAAKKVASLKLKIR